jgi:hypothetical protein
MLYLLHGNIQKETDIETKKLFTIISRDFVTSVQSLKVDSNP